MTVTRAQVVAEARRWIGVPYKKAGAHKIGCNCMGLIFGVARELGMDEFWNVFVPYQGMARPESNFSLVSHMRRLCTSIPLRDVQPADLLLYVSGGNTASHIAWVVDRKGPQMTIIHADIMAKKVVEIEARDRALKAYQVPGVV